VVGVSSPAAEPRLSQTSFVVLGLIERAEPATPYDLKQLAALSTSNFWTVPHTQLYTECERLAGEGLLDETREQTGRRRRSYRLTRDGRKLLDRWRAEPTGELYELRDEGLLKLFFGADPVKLAQTQLQAHIGRLGGYEALLGELGAHMPDGQRLALEAGIAHEKEFVRFWRRLAAGAPGGAG
jgi:PadR family transcriptional regulator, regulatory protein AphA